MWVPHSHVQSARATALERPSASAAEAAAGKAAAPKAGAAGGAGARGRDEGRGRLVVEGVQAGHQEQRVVTRGIVAVVPVRWLQIHVFEGVGPLALDAQRHGIGQVLVEQFGMALQALDVIFLRPIEKLFKALDADARLGAAHRARRHNQGKQNDDDSRADRGQDGGEG